MLDEAMPKVVPCWTHRQGEEVGDQQAELAPYGGMDQWMALVEVQEGHRPGVGRGQWAALGL